jgi:hypothetical protein
MCDVPTNLLVFYHIIFLSSLTHALIFSGELHYAHATKDMDHGAPQSHRETIMDQDRHTGRERERQHYLSPVDNSSSHNTGSSIPHVHGFDSYMTPIPHNWSKMCNGYMSMRIQSSITCWYNNDK